MVVSEVPVFLFPLAAGPATASLEFITGDVDGLACDTALRVDPCWVDVADKTFDIITCYLKLLLLTLSGRCSVAVYVLFCLFALSKQMTSKDVAAVDWAEGSSVPAWS